MGYRNITLVEGRDRLGGRVHTSHAWRETPVDLGASWIHGTRRNPITRLAKEAGVPMEETDYEDMGLFGASGAPLSRTDERELSRLTRKLFRAVNATYSSNADHLQMALRQGMKGLDKRELELMDHLIHSNIELSFAEDVEALDARALMFGKEFKGHDVLFPQGYFGVFEHRYTPFRVLLNQPVTAIRKTGKEITVQTSRGDLTADRVIVTLPLGVLQQGLIEFSPGFAKSKRDALHTLGMGCLNKLYLRFPEAFWPETQGFSYMGPTPGAWSDWLNLNAVQPEPVLLVFHSGTIARELEHWSDEEHTDGAMTVLRQMFGNSIPDPDGVQVTRWAQGPFSLGSYSCLRPGSNQSIIQTLRAPIGDRIFFAGEATSLEYPSTVHGAYLSGQRAAKELLSSS